jgi:hypothetical protein
VYANNIYVSSVSGSDSAGDGSIHNSFKTLTRALEYAETFADTIPITINLSSGQGIQRECCCESYFNFYC